MGHYTSGSALIKPNRAEEGIVKLSRGLAALRAFGAEVDRVVGLAELAEGYCKVARAAEGLAIVAEGLAESQRIGNHWFEAELHRLNGELLLRGSPQASRDETQACFRQALKVAKRQKAKWWELQATISLARLLAKQGHREQARAMLAEIYNWFTEGFDTADLKDAWALLDQLADVA